MSPTLTQCPHYIPMTFFILPGRQSQFLSLCHYHVTFNHQSETLPIKYPASFFTQFLVLPTHTCLVAYRQGQPSVPIP